MSKKLNRIGEKYITTEGYAVEIIEYFDRKNCTVMFKNGVVIRNKSFENIKKGLIFNPYHKSVLKVGYTGEGSFSVTKNGKTTLHYTTWRDMLRRGYDDLHIERNISYKNVTVCEEWHNFQNFAKWFEENYVEGWQLDKDILVKSNKIYSPETCCFVPSEINNILLGNNINRGNYPLGVSKRGEKFIASFKIKRISKHLGYFNTPEEAFQAYKTAKEQYIKEVAEKWKDKISEKVYQVMIDYKVKITD